MAALAMIMALQDSREDGASVFQIKKEMSDIYTDFAVNLALTALLRKHFVESFQRADNNGNDYTFYRLMTPGEEWLIDNQDKFTMHKEPPPPREL
jgi:hypothetical protein